MIQPPKSLGSLNILAMNSIMVTQNAVATKSGAKSITVPISLAALLPSRPH
jgi:hypothetical protein